MPKSEKAAPTIKVSRDFKVGKVAGQVAIGSGNIQFSNCTFVLPDGSALPGKSWFFTQGVRPSTDPKAVFGRQDDLRKIEELFRDNHAVALIGLEGIGKSTLASKYFERLETEETTRYAGIYWRRMDDTVKISDLIGSFFAVIGKPIDKLDSYQLEDQLSLFFKELNAAPYFLVLDNFEALVDSATNKPVKTGFSDLIETASLPTGLSHFLLTCGECPSCERGIKPAWHRVDGLDSEAALRLLKSRGLDGTASELEKAVEQSGGHPLALILLVQLVNQEEETLTEALADDSMWEDDVARNILDKVYCQLSEKEQKLLQYVSLFREPVPAKAIVAVANDPTWTEAMCRKDCLNLSRKSPLNKSGDYFWEDSLTRNYAFDKMPYRESRHMLACRYYVSIPVPAEPTKKEDIQPLIEAHYHACRAKEYDKAAEILLKNNMFDKLEKWGNYNTLVELFAPLLPSDPFNGKPLLTNVTTHGAALGYLGAAYRDLGEAKKAIEYYKKALEIAQQTSDKERENLWLGYLGIAHDDLCEYDTAIQWYEKALNTARQNGYKEHECRWRGDLGVSYYNQGKYRESIGIYEQALALAQQNSYERLEGRWLGDIGCAYDDLDKHDIALEYYEKALKIAREIGDRRDEGTWLGFIGHAQMDLGKPNEALDFLRKSLDVAREIGDKLHEGNWLGYLGYVYQSMKNYDTALDNYKQALEIAKLTGDKRNEGIWLTKIGELFKETGRKNQETLACFLLAKQIRAKLGNAKDSEETEKNLADLKRKMGEGDFNRLLESVGPNSLEILTNALSEPPDKNAN
ncbi:MAG: tetratricopeptide repeat protein [Candidatus Bathyarchaeia archaeon]